MDAVLRSVQTGTQESQSSPSRSLRVRLGVVMDSGTPNQHRDHLIPLTMRGINLTRQHRPTLPSEHALPGWYGSCLHNVILPMH